MLRGVRSKEGIKNALSNHVNPAYFQRLRGVVGRMSAIADVIAAERSLARLDVALGDRGRRLRYRHDAARRSSLALARLDGWMVDQRDLLVALASPADVGIYQRSEATQAADLVRLLVDLDEGLVPGVRPRVVEEDEGSDRKASASPALSVGSPKPAAGAAGDARDLIARIRQDLALAKEALDESGNVDVQPEELATQAMGPGKMQPWSRAWVEEVHRRWHLVFAGAEPKPFELDRQDAVVEALEVIDEVLASNPGLLGVARAVHRLHWLPAWPEAPRAPVKDGENAENRAVREFIERKAKPLWWPWFARLTVPALVRRACGLVNGAPPLPCMFLMESPAFWNGIGSGEREWLELFSGWSAVFMKKEEEHEVAIEAAHGRLREVAMQPALRPLRLESQDQRYRARARVATKRRSNSKVPVLLDLLAELPVISSGHVRDRLRVAHRNALVMIQDLEKAGVLHEISGRGAFRLWRCQAFG